MKPKSSKEYAYELLKSLFPFKESDLVRTSFLLKETDTKIEDFRVFVYKIFSEEDFTKINLENSDISSVFYWYAVMRVSDDYAEYFSKKEDLTERLIVEDKFYPPMYKLKEQNALLEYTDFINSFTEEIKEKIALIPSEKQTKLFKWLIKQIFSDLIYNYFKLNRNELFPDILTTIPGDNIKVFVINERKLENMLNIKFDKLEEVEIFYNK